MFRARRVYVYTRQRVRRVTAGRIFGYAGDREDPPILAQTLPHLFPNHRNGMK